MSTETERFKESWFWFGSGFFILLSCLLWVYRVSFTRLIEERIEQYTNIILTLLILGCIFLATGIVKTLIASSDRKDKTKEEQKEEPVPMDDKKLLWDFIFILYSVALSFSISNASASTVRIFTPGNFIYFLLGNPMDITGAISTFVFSALIILNVFLIAYVWKNKRFYIENIRNFYFKVLIAFAIGSTPMIFYYIAFLFSKSVLNMSL